MNNGSGPVGRWVSSGLPHVHLLDGLVVQLCLTVRRACLWPVGDRRGGTGRRVGGHARARGRPVRRGSVLGDGHSGEGGCGGNPGFNRIRHGLKNEGKATVRSMLLFRGLSPLLFLTSSHKMKCAVELRCVVKTQIKSTVSMIRLCLP